VPSTPPPITLGAFLRYIRYKLYFVCDTGNFLRYKSATTPLHRYIHPRKRHGSALNVREISQLSKNKTTTPEGENGA
jgi:hypothetical protein